MESQDPCVTVADRWNETRKNTTIMPTYSNVSLTEQPVTLLRRPLPPTVDVLPSTISERCNTKNAGYSTKSIQNTSQVSRIVAPLFDVDNNYLSDFTTVPSGSAARIAPKPTPDLSYHPHIIDSSSLVSAYVRTRHVHNVHYLSPFKRAQYDIKRKQNNKFTLSASRHNQMNCVPTRLTLYPISDTHPSVMYPDFTFQDFILKLSETDNLPLDAVTRVMHSRRNYEEIQKWLIEQCMPPPQDELHIVDLKLPNDFEFARRIPTRHLLIELAAELREQISELTGRKMKSKIIKLPQYKPDSRLTDISSYPDTEILLYEDSSDETSGLPSQQSLHVMKQTEIPGKDSVLSTNRTKFFQGAERSSSPFISTDPNLISPAEVSILNSLMNGGKSLNLKAHFISVIPDITRLMDTLVYLNLSYNCFVTLPNDLFDIKNINVLKLRNNPLKLISVNISWLSSLRILILSYCLLEELPSELFQLKLLEILDVAYNKLSELPSEVGQLEYLEELMVEGNQLTSLPVSVLRLKRLRSVCVINNFMHPLFWVESSINNPQTLRDLSCLVLRQAMHESALPDFVKEVINKPQRCDCCEGPRYGPGLRTMRPVPRLCSVLNVPIVFRSCSSKCLSGFMSKKDDLSEMLYKRD